MSIYYRDEQVTLHLGNALDVLPEIPDASVDAVVCDPPYALANLHPNVVIDTLTKWLAGDRAYIPSSGQGGFMGASWDEFVPPPAAWDECLRVLKPGGHLLAFAAPRTQDLMGMSIRIAGFEIREGIDWIFGNGMPKGQNIAKGIDRRRDDRADILAVTAWLASARDAAGWTTRQLNEAFGFSDKAVHWTTQNLAAAVPTPEQWEKLRGLLGFDDTEILPLVESLNARKGHSGEAWDLRPVVTTNAPGMAQSWTEGAGWNGNIARAGAPVLPEAAAWEGWNTSLKPAHEPIIVARKSTGFNTVVANVLEHGTGAINVDACRIEVADTSYARNAAGRRGHADNRTRQAEFRQTAGSANALGRWPANVIFTHSPNCGEQCADGCPIADLDAQTGTLTSGVMAAGTTRANRSGYSGAMPATTGTATHGDNGGASRYFPAFRYEGKAPASERPRLADGTTWPTVKPLELMRWLVRLVTPPGGTILDPFCGTGTTGEAAIIEGFSCILIEQDLVAAELTKSRLEKPIQSSLFGLEAS